MTKSMNSKIKRFPKKLLYFASLVLLYIFVLLGGWCLPLKMLEKAVLRMKAKFNIEYVQRDDTNSDDDRSQ